MSNLPKGWLESQLGELAVVDSGVGFPKDFQGKTDGDYPVYKVGDVSRAVVSNRGGLSAAQNYVSKEEAEELRGRIFQPGSTLFAKIGEALRLNRRAFVERAGLADNNVMGVKPLLDEMDKFTHYFLRQTDIASLSRSTTVPSVRKGDVESLRLPLPPLNEQKRIADKLDRLLARVDAVKVRLDRIPAILKRLRQSILAAATTGKLTEEWRRQAVARIVPWTEHIQHACSSLPDGYTRLTKRAHEQAGVEFPRIVLPIGWAVTTIAELYDRRVLVDYADGNHGSFYPRKEDFGSIGVPFLTAMQIGENWELGLSACPRLRNEKARLLTKGWARPNDVLLTHNATVGRVAILEDSEQEILLGTSATFYRFNPNCVEPRFARIVFSAPFFQEQLHSVMEQTTRNQVPITKQASLNFVCPPIEEQREIVRRVEELFAIADRIEAQYQAARARVDRLTQSLLAKAFRGELVPQDPNDEPAWVLLERIRARRAAAPKPKRGRRKVAQPEDLPMVAELKTPYGVKKRRT